MDQNDRNPGPQDGVPGPSQEVCFAFAVRRAARNITRRYEAALAPLNMTTFQFSTLKALEKAGHLSLSRIADLFSMDISTVTRNIRPLLAKGWVSLDPDSSDGRKRLARLTELGHANLQAALPLWQKAQAESQAQMLAMADMSHLDWLRALS